MKTKAIFFGTPKIATPTLEAISQVLNVVGVITEFDKPAGRGQKMSPTPVKVLAEKLGLNIFQPETKGDIAPIIKQLKPDIGILVAYGKIIPQSVIGLFKYGILNIHGSLLPKYRGASPVQYAILNNEQQTGATIMLLDSGVDTGPIIGAATVEIDKKDTTPSLAKKIIEAGTNKLIEVLPSYIRGDIKAQPQTGEASYAPKLSKEQGKIDWSKSAQELECQIKAFTPWPKSYTSFRNQKIIIHQAKISNDRLIPTVVQIEGRSVTSWPEFLNGYHLDEATALIALTGVDQNMHS